MRLRRIFAIASVILITGCLPYVKVEDFNAKIAELNNRMVSVPVGGVIPFYLTPWEIEKLAPYWLPADGTLIKDPQSPLNGRYLPDLTERMVLGKGKDVNVTSLIPSIPPELQGGSLNFDFIFKQEAKQTAGVKFPWGINGKVQEVHEPDFTIDTVVDEMKHANHTHEFEFEINKKVDIKFPPYRGLVYMVRVR